MSKVILLTGATDGIGLATAEMMVPQGHTVLLHGRNPAKLESVKEKLSALEGARHIESYLADLSRMADVEALAKAVAAKHTKLDVLINNAGVLIAHEKVTVDGLDTHFAVNTIAPYLLTQRLLPLFGSTGRVVNLSSRSQVPLVPEQLAKPSSLSDDDVYGQSKLALTMWSRDMGLSLKDKGPAIIAVNPRSLLGTKMVKEAYGIPGSDIHIGADILYRAAFSDEFNDASGLYFDNDLGRFNNPHPDALNEQKCKDIVRVIESVLAEITQ